MKPLIAISGSRHINSLKVGPPIQGVVLGDDYAQGVEQAGGLPLVIPYLEVQDSIQELAERADGLLLSGGVDIDPSLFGAEPRNGLGEVTPERDVLEVELIRAVRALGKPVLGICRGIQVLNAAFGGTLYQDLAREWKGTIQHTQRAPRGHLSHTVHIEPGSRLFDLLGGASQIKTNSFHHQAVKTVAPGMVPVAWDEEGLIEAIECPGEEFVLAVQWHPENLWRGHPQFLGLFRGLVERAAMVAVQKQ